MVASLHKTHEFKDIKAVKCKVSDILEANPDPRFTISDLLWSSHQARTERNRLKGNGFRHNIVDVNGVANTLTSRYGKDGRENLILQPGKNPRMFTPRECARLMGFKDSFILPETKTPAYRQLGNSVCVPIIEELALQVNAHILEALEEAVEYGTDNTPLVYANATQAVPLAG